MVAAQGNTIVAAVDVVAWRVAPILEDDAASATIADALQRSTMRKPACMSPEQFHHATKMLRNLPMVSITSESVTQTLAAQGCPLPRTSQRRRALTQWIQYLKRGHRTVLSRLDWVPEQISQLCRSRNNYYSTRRRSASHLRIVSFIRDAGVQRIVLSNRRMRNDPMIEKPTQLVVLDGWQVTSQSVFIPVTCFAMIHAANKVRSGRYATYLYTLRRSAILQRFGRFAKHIIFIRTTSLGHGQTGDLLRRQVERLPPQVGRHHRRIPDGFRDTAKYH